jgi:hypothetical protein
MASEAVLRKIPALKANADLSAKQYLFVKIAAAKAVDVCSAATDRPVGILQNKPTSGQNAEVAFLGVSKVVCGGTITAGDQIGTDANGKAVSLAAGTDTTKFVVGIALEAGASGRIISALIDTPAIGRAA